MSATRWWEIKLELPGFSKIVLGLFNCSKRNPQNLLTDPERSKGRRKGSTEVRKKGKKVQSDNTVNEQEAPDALICNRCKGIFTNVNAKMIYCDRCQKWYCTKCVNISDAFSSFLASKKADDIAWFCQSLQGTSQESNY